MSCKPNPSPAEAHVVRVDIPSGFQEIAETALLRLGYLYPAAIFTIVDGVIAASVDTGADFKVLEREIRYALYRERIYTQTLDLRQALIDAVTRR